MTVTIENPSYNEIDVAFKKRNITSHDINESIPSSDEMLLFKPKILQAIKFVFKNKFQLWTLCKSGASNISKDTVYSIIPELIKQKILENKKSAYGDSFRIIAERDIKSSEQLRFCNINDNCDHQSSQDDSGTSIINPQPFIVDEQDVTPLPSPTSKIEPGITSNVNTPLPQNKSNISFEEHQQFLYRIEAHMSGLKSHMKCELSTMSNKKDSLLGFVNSKINNLNDQQKIPETLRENIKLLQIIK